MDRPDVPIQYWLLFLVGVGVLLFLDLFVFHRKAHHIRPLEALGWTGFWVSLAVAFNVWVYFKFGEVRAIQFLTGYLIEEALSVDNIFVFVVVFRHFQVPPQYQHRILFWGILGAIVMRFIFIFLGVELIENIRFTVYILGGFLIITAIKLLLHKEENLDPGRSLVLRLFRRYVPTTTQYEGPRFLVRRDGRLLATPLLLVLLVVESTDVVFAVDSVPAIIAITTDRFIVFTSNIFAILGLRSLYFVLAGMIDVFRYLKVGLSLVLLFVGVKMILSSHVPITPRMSLGVIAGIIGTSVAASLLLGLRRRPPAGPGGSEEGKEGRGLGDPGLLE